MPPEGSGGLDSALGAVLGPGPGRPWEHPASPGDYPGFVGPSWSVLPTFSGYRGPAGSWFGRILGHVGSWFGRVGSPCWVVFWSCSVGYCTGLVSVGFGLGLMLVFGWYSLGLAWIGLVFLTPLRSSR